MSVGHALGRPITRFGRAERVTELPIRAAIACVRHPSDCRAVRAALTPIQWGHLRAEAVRADAANGGCPLPTDTPIRRMSLSQSLYGFVVVTLLAMAAAFAVLISGRSEALVDDALDTAVRVRADAAAAMFARTLESDWRDVEFLARELARPGADARGLMDGMRGDGSRISWIGLAGLDGTIVTATGGMLEGVDASARPWFRLGLQGGFAGDVHEAVLLAELLQGADGEPPRFIDLARPVTDETGAVTGVVAMHIDFAWAAAQLDRLARDLRLDLFLVASDGRVIVSTDGTLPERTGLQVLRTAETGATGSGRETWPDGHDYFATLVPRVASGDLPSFGWRLVGRIDAASFRPGFDGMRTTGLAAVLGVVALLFGLTALYVRQFIRPLERLAHSAERISSGGNDYPPEVDTTREMAAISAALARLQQRTGRRIRSELL